MAGFQQSSKGQSRRKILKTVGSTTAGLAIGSASTAGAAGPDNGPGIDFRSEDELEAIASQYRSEEAVQKLVDEQDRLLGLLSSDGLLDEPDVEIRNVHTGRVTDGDPAFDEDGTFVWGMNSENGAHAHVVVRRRLERAKLRIILTPGTDLHPRAKVVPDNGRFNAYYEPAAPDIPDRTAAIRSQRVDTDSLDIGNGDTVQVSSVSTSDSFTVSGFAFNGCWETTCGDSAFCFVFEYRCSGDTCYREDCLSEHCCRGDCMCCNLDYCCEWCPDDPCSMCEYCEDYDGSCCSKTDCLGCDCNDGCTNIKDYCKSK